MPPEKLQDSLERLALEMKERDDFAIVAHHDADGLSSGAILAKSLERENKKYQIKVVKQLYSETIEEIKGLGENYVFADFGSGQLDILAEHFPENSFIFDHHQPLNIDHPYHINPFHYGIDGGNEISGAGVCYLFARTLNPINKDLSPLAIVGALGDMQDFSGKLKGINREILKDATDQKLIKVENDLRLYGRISRPLTQFLEFSSNPIIPELTANSEACLNFLKENHIPIKRNEQWLSYSDLYPEEKKKLTTALILHLHRHNTPEWKIRELVGETYTLLKEAPKSPLRDAKEFATVLNACGRNAQFEIGLKVAMGDRFDYYQKALSLLSKHRRQLRDGIELMKTQGVEERETFFFFDAETNIKDSLVGIIAGMLYSSGNIDAGKPIIAFARHEDGSIKVSARATSDLVYKGINLGKTLKEVCAELGEGSEGGGHKIAAGCRIQENEKEPFLKKLNEKLKETYT